MSMNPATAEKSDKLLDANRRVVSEQTCVVEPGQEAISLAGVNLILQEQQTYLKIMNEAISNYDWFVEQEQALKQCDFPEDTQKPMKEFHHKLEATTAWANEMHSRVQDAKQRRKDIHKADLKLKEAVTDCDLVADLTIEKEQALEQYEFPKDMQQPMKEFYHKLKATITWANEMHSRMIESQMSLKAQQVTELKSEAEYLKKMDPQKEEEIVVTKSDLEDRLLSPLLEKKATLLKKNEAYHQFRKDIEDEILWLTENKRLNQSSDYGNSLFSVQMLKKKIQSLRTQFEYHEPNMMNICENVQKFIIEGHEDSDEIQRLIDDHLQQLSDVKKALRAREDKLLESEKAQ